MSGQPYRYAKDVANFRQDYMEALGLRANLDDANLQANKNFKETGSLPPKSQMKDMRTTPEILADTEKLKLSLIAELKPVCSVSMAQAVIQRVQQSPLNGDGSFFTWFAQSAPELVANLKKKYKFGIAGDSNDIEQMVSFLSSIYTKTRDMSQTVKSAFDRPAGSDALGVAVGDFEKLKQQYDDIYLRLVSSPGQYRLRDTIKRQLDSLNRILNNPPNRYNRVKDRFQQISQGVNIGAQMNINSRGYQDWILYTDKIPSPSSVRTLLEQIKKAERNVNADLTDQLLINLSSILPTSDESDRIYQITENIIGGPGAPPGLPPPPALPGGPGLNIVGPPPPGPVPGPGAVGPAGPFGGVAARDAGDVVDELLTVIWNLAQQNAPPGGMGGVIAFNFGALVEPNARANLIANGVNLGNVNYNPAEIRQAVSNFTQNDINHVLALDANHGGTLGQFIRGEDLNLRHAIRNVGGYSMIGFGIRRKGRPKGSGVVKPLAERIDHTKGIKQGHTHVPFGKYILNKNKLDSDQVYFKHTKGYGVKGFPVTKVSKKLGHVLRTIIGGGVPKFEELSGLSEQEKEYLHKIANKAGIMDKLSIPSPSKDKLEQDIHQFEVMKGELMSGNDSPEMIKKFKLLLLRLSKNGTLPKREASELMEELIQLGY